MAKKRDPELLTKIEALQQQLQSLVQEFKGSEDDADREDQANGRKVREPLDAELVERVRRMSQERPVFFTEIVAETGETENTIKAVLTRLQRDGELIVNIGQANKALWYTLAPRVAARVMKRLSELGVRSEP